MAPVVSDASPDMRKTSRGVWALPSRTSSIASLTSSSARSSEIDPGQAAAVQREDLLEVVVGADDRALDR